MLVHHVLPPPGRTINLKAPVIGTNYLIIPIYDNELDQIQYHIYIYLYANKDAPFWL